jgi:hypothetical protein
MPRAICRASRPQGRMDKQKHVPQTAVGYALACPAGRQPGPGVWGKGAVPIGWCLKVGYRQGREIHWAARKLVESRLRASSARLDKLKLMPQTVGYALACPAGRQPGRGVWGKGAVPIGWCLKVRYRQGREIHWAARNLVESLRRASFARLDKLKLMPQTAVGYALACPAGRQPGSGVRGRGAVPIGWCLKVRYRQGRGIHWAARKLVESWLRASFARLDKLKHVPLESQGRGR